MAIVYLCSNCSSKIRAPGQMGRSWCPNCESYIYPLAEDLEEGDQLESQSNATWVYTAVTPSPSRMNADERPDHKFAYTKRRDRTRKGITQFKARCTCKQLKDSDWKQSKRLSHIDWENHMVDIEKLQRMPI